MISEHSVYNPDLERGWTWPRFMSYYRGFNVISNNKGITLTQNTLTFKIGFRAFLSAGRPTPFWCRSIISVRRPQYHYESIRDAEMNKLKWPLAFSRADGDCGMGRPHTKLQNTAWSGENPSSWANWPEIVNPQSINESQSAQKTRPPRPLSKAESFSHLRTVKK